MTNRYRYKYGLKDVAEVSGKPLWKVKRESGEEFDPDSLEDVTKYVAKAKGVGAWTITEIAQVIGCSAEEVEVDRKRFDITQFASTVAYVELKKAEKMLKLQRRER